MLLESILSMLFTYPHTLLHFSLFFNLRWLIRSPIVRSQWLLHDSLNKIPSAISEGATSATSFFNDHLFCERFARLNPTILRGILGGAEYSHLYNPANSQVQDLATGNPAHRNGFGNLTDEPEKLCSPVLSFKTDRKKTVKTFACFVLVHRALIYL